MDHQHALEQQARTLKAEARALFDRSTRTARKAIANRRAYAARVFVRQADELNNLFDLGQAHRVQRLLAQAHRMERLQR